MIVGLTLSLSGCSVFRPNAKDLPEYNDARNAIESYEDEDGNWIRPEGTKAEKRKGSVTYKATSWIPGLGERPIDKEKAKSEMKEADAFFEQAKNSEGEERAKLFRQAADKYEDAAKNWSSSALEENCWFMAGESHFFAEDYYRAEQHYAKLLKERPRSRYQDTIDSRRMEIAMYWLQYDNVDHKPFYVVNFTDNRRPWNDTKGHGKRALENIRLANPTGKLSDDVTMALGNEAFQEGDYENAADHYADLRMTYADSPHQFEAHFLGLKSVIETYQGPDYNESPLKEADKLIKQITRQFPNETQEHKEFIQKAYAEVRYRKAERLWNQANYRMKRNENNSAKIYLDQILVEYSDTPFAEKAREAQKEVENLPDDPPQRFQWIARWFPDPDPVKPFLERSE